MLRRKLTAIALLGALTALAAPAAASANIITFTDDPAHPGGHYQTDTTVTITGTLTMDDGTTPVSGATVTWSVSGANTASGSGPTGPDGQFTISYPGTNEGDDFIQASEPGGGANSTTAIISQGEVTISGASQFDYNGPLPTQDIAVTDGNGQTVSDYRYSISGPNGVGDTLGSSPAVTWPSKNIGSDVITVYRDLPPLNQTQDPGEPFAQRTITISTGTLSLSNPSPAFTDAGADVPVFLEDGGGNPITGTVTWTLTGANATSGTVPVTSGSGTIHIPGTTAGTSTLTATYDAPGTNQDPTNQVSFQWYPRIRPGGSAISSITIGPDQWCQVTYTGDTSPEFYSSYPGSCGTYLRVGSVNYGPGSLTPRGTSAWTGTGTRADPYTIVVSDDVASTGLIMQSTIRYVTGDDFYRQDVSVTDNGGGAQDVVIAQYADCYLQNSDSGYGFRDTTSGGAYCTKTANNNPAGRLEGFVPLSGGSSNIVDGFGNVLPQLSATGFPNTCTCTTLLDNGMGLAFPASVPAGGSTSRSFLVTFSPTGTTPDLIGPTPTILSPANGGETTDPQPLIAGTAGTAAGDLPTVHVAIYSGNSASGNPVQSFDATAAAGSWSGRPATALPVGTYTATATQADDRGNSGTSGASTFTVRAATPQPQPQPQPQPVPPPSPDRSGNVQTLSGTVCVILPGQKQCIPIQQLSSIPVGTIVDATHGVVELTTSADAKGHTQSGTFSGGQFLFTQLTEKQKQKGAGKHGKPKTVSVLITQLALRGGGDPSSCPKGSRGSRAVMAAKAPFSRRLKADAHGHFRTKGRYAAATVRGTAWTTRDDCKGTLVAVTRHEVLVTDFVKKKTVLVKAGHQYLATGHGRRRR